MAVTAISWLCSEDGIWDSTLNASLTLALWICEPGSSTAMVGTPGISWFVVPMVRPSLSTTVMEPSGPLRTACGSAGETAIFRRLNSERLMETWSTPGICSRLFDRAEADTRSTGLPTADCAFRSTVCADTHWFVPVTSMDDAATRHQGANSSAHAATQTAATAPTPMAAALFRSERRADLRAAAFRAAWLLSSASGSGESANRPCFVAASTAIWSATGIAGSRRRGSTNDASDAFVDPAARRAETWPERAADEAVRRAGALDAVLSGLPFEPDATTRRRPISGGPPRWTGTAPVRRIRPDARPAGRRAGSPGTAAPGE